jgi:predicted ATPase/class 3 adenylate cyclase
MGERDCPGAGVTLAFLFTDIEGSTQLWEADPAAMQAALARHDALLRIAIAETGGRVFKTVGDAFCAVFADVPGAVAAALAGQAALRGDGFPEIGGLRVRMAVHAGIAELRDGDYFGQALNRVARLLAIGHGGQVLLSGAATELAMGRLPPGTSLRDLGPHRLKDIARPEPVHQLVATGLTDSFPALRGEPVRRTNLPEESTAIIGRDRELAEVARLIEGNRLVTLVGAGGIGKTRMALRTGADLLDRYPDGAWIVELAPLSEPRLVAESVASVFGLAVGADRAPLQSLVGFLRQKRALLLLDNCEHLVSAAAQLAEAVLRGCPAMTILATSREPLAIAGESTFRMPSLGYPTRPEGLSAGQALEHGAVRLLAERARLVAPGFAVTDENASDLAAICKRLDGVALAIELAAARLRMMQPRELAARLDDRFRILSGGSRTALPRQQTLKALIGWSYDLLSEPERAMLRRLSVFAGGCTLESAVAVTAGDGIADWEVLDLLGSLVDKSLVVADQSPAGTRYRLLESTRHFGTERLAESGERPPSRALAAYLASFLERADAAWPAAPTDGWLQAAAPELDNWRTSLDWCLGPQGDAAAGLALTAHALRLLQELSLLAELRRCFAAALARLDGATPPAVAARLWLGKAYTYNQFNEPAQAEPALRAASLFAAAGDLAGQGLALARAGASLMNNGDTARSDPLLRQAEDLLRPRGPSKTLAACIHYRGVYHYFSGDGAAAREVIAEAAAMARALGDRSGLRTILISLGEVQFGTGFAEQAVATIREVIAEGLAQNDRRAVTHARPNLAAYSLALGDVATARSAARDALPDALSLGLPYYFANAVELLALVAALAGDLERAARLQGYAIGWYEANGLRRQLTEQVGHERLTGLLAGLAPTLRDRMIAEGRSWTAERAAAEAIEV